MQASSLLARRQGQVCKHGISLGNQKRGVVSPLPDQLGWPPILDVPGCQDVAVRVQLKVVVLDLAVDHMVQRAFHRSIALHLSGGRKQDFSLATCPQFRASTAPEVPIVANC